jgi:uncharacterized protein
MRKTESFHVMIKPGGPVCNLNCAYCFYLNKKALFQGSRFLMPDSMLEEFTRQYIQSQRTSEIVFAWQGGEPTLLGVDFFKRAIAYQEKYKRVGTEIQNTIQTNGTLLNDEWGQFFHENNFLIGVSLDGPPEMHNEYRINKAGKPTFAQVIRGLEYLHKYRVEFNILTTIHAANENHPLDVYRFLRDEVGARYIQFIPIVVQQSNPGSLTGNQITDYSVDPEKYGRFLNAVFDEWVVRDVAQVFVQMFDISLAAWAGEPGAICIFAPTCGKALAMEHNGSLYSCDHFVTKVNYLGNITRHPLAKLVNSHKQKKFAEKKNLLPQNCHQCQFLFACNGGCPKDRIITVATEKYKTNYLCPGYKLYFKHVSDSMEIMSDLLRNNRAPSEIMQLSLASLSRADFLMQPAPSLLRYRKPIELIQNGPG